MGSIPLAFGIAVTSLNLTFADLPSEVKDYSGKSWDITRFYDQKIPNIHLGGYKILDDRNYVQFQVDTGTHTKKINTAGLTLAYSNIKPLNNSWELKTTLTVSGSWVKNTKCYSTGTSDVPLAKGVHDFHCGTLTPWNDYTKKELLTENYGINISLTKTW